MSFFSLRYKWSIFSVPAFTVNISITHVKGYVNETYEPCKRMRHKDNKDKHHIQEIEQKKKKDSSTFSKRVQPKMETIPPFTDRSCYMVYSGILQTLKKKGYIQI
jgi:hypothetical protein